MKRFAVVLVASLLMLGIGPVAAGSSGDPALKLATEYASANAAKNPDGIAATFAEDGVYVDTQDPGQGQRRGGQEIVEYFQQLYASYPDLSFTIDGIVMQPDTSRAPYAWATVSWTFEGTHTVDTKIAGPPTGNAVIIHGVDIVEVSVLQQPPVIVEVRSYYDGNDFVRQDQGN